MTTKGYSAIILILIAFAMTGQSGAQAQQLRIGLPSKPITMPLPQQPTYQPQQLLTMDPPEYRMSWVFSFGSEFASPDATTTLINRLADNNFNVVVPEIRKRGDAYYNSAYEPWATDVVAGYDPLRDILDKAHARNMEVWGWIVTFRIWQRNMVAPPTHMWSKHPEWAMLNWSGSNQVGNNYNFDPGIPGVQQYVCDVVKDVVTKYPDLDGFNFDYIRYEAYNWGYNAISKERFRREYGYYPPTSTYDSHWGDWCDWKRKQITSFVKKCYLEAIYLNPRIKMTVSTIGWMGGDPTTDFTTTRAYKEVCQNHSQWMEDHIIDVNVLMNYKRDWCTAAEPCWYSNGRTYCGGDQQGDHRLWSDYLSIRQAATGTHAIDGIGAYLNVLPGIMAQWQHSRAKGIGLGTYRYGFDIGLESSTPGKPVFNRGTTTVSAGSEDTFYSTIKSTLFQNPAPVPDMPWKSNPTTGYLFGQITDAMEPDDPTYGDWVYQATVTATGPAGPGSTTYTTDTDATGTYGFIGLPPGNYMISVQAASHNPITNYATSVSVGLATRVDLQLGPAIDPDDYKTITEARDPSQVTENQLIGLSGKVATVSTGTIAGCVYVEEEDRCAAMQVRFGSISPTVAEGDRVDFIGFANTVNGERMLTHAAMVARASGAALGALRSSVQDLDLTPSSTALLVQCAGTVVDTGVGWFTLYDGSGTVKALCPGLIGPAKNALVTVTGLSGYSGGRTIRARRQSDIAITSGTSVTVPTGTIGVGFNLISFPYVPADPTPATVFGTTPISSKLFRWDNVTQAFTGYDSLNPDIFGKLSPTQGYALLTTGMANVSYQGLATTSDVRISIPKKGWSLIAQPLATVTIWNNLQVTDGTETKSLQDAITAGWIGRIAFTWDAASGDWGYVGTGARGSRFDDSLRPWHAYWITTYRDDLAVIIPSAG